MKKLVLVAVLVAGMLSITSCKKESQESFGKTETTTDAPKPEDLGAEIFNGKGACTACHQPDVKVVGPSLQEIAKIYKEKNGDMISFFKGNSQAIVDPEQFNLMQANIELTKTFTDEELKALEAYMYSHLK